MDEKFSASSLTSIGDPGLSKGNSDPGWGRVTASVAKFLNLRMYSREIEKPDMVCRCNPALGGSLTQLLAGQQHGANSFFGFSHRTDDSKKPIKTIGKSSHISMTIDERDELDRLEILFPPSTPVRRLHQEFLLRHASPRATPRSRIR